MPPLPDGLSELLQDFLTMCFNKEPSQRPDAVQLFEHPWLKNKWGIYKVRWALGFPISLLLTISQEPRSQDSIPFLRRVNTEVQRSDIRSLSFADDDRPASPRLTTSLASAAADVPPRAHDFVKSTFAQGEIHQPFMSGESC